MHEKICEFWINSESITKCELNAYINSLPEPLIESDMDINQFICKYNHLKLTKPASSKIKLSNLVIPDQYYFFNKPTNILQLLLVEEAKLLN